MKKREGLEPGAGRMVLTLASMSGMTVTAAIRELIDNALDAGATVIRITYDPKRKRLIIEDNGRGTDKAKLIVTPFKHGEHATTLSGRYGIGGTMGLVFLCAGRGTCEVITITKRVITELVADFNEMVNSDRLEVEVESRPNDGRPSGTRIVLDGCIELSPNNVGTLRRELSVTFTPTLRRKGTRISFQVTGKEEQVWEPYKAPELVMRVPIAFEIEGRKVKGFVGLTKPGETSMINGYAIAWAHRYIKIFKTPAADRSVDLSRIYSEVVLDEKPWGDVINATKEDFIREQSALMAALADVSAPVFDRCEAEGATIELESSIRETQKILDELTGYEPRVKGRRERQEKPEKPGTVAPTGKGSPHQNFSKEQPGDKGKKGATGLPNRIRFQWKSGGDVPWEISPEGRNIFVSFNSDDPDNVRLYREKEGAGENIAEMILMAISWDSRNRPDVYRTLLPQLDAERAAERFMRLRERRRKQTSPAKVA